VRNTSKAWGELGLAMIELMNFVADAFGWLSKLFSTFTSYRPHKVNTEIYLQIIRTE